jgi:hypothetical protein
MPSFLLLLSQTFPAHAPHLQAAQPSLSALIYAHARFPFSRPVPLTRDALLRAVMLLTQRGALFFSRPAIGPVRRTARDRLRYMFLALAGVGVVDSESIVEVLVRLPFPLPSHATLGPGKKRSHFEQLAHRLDPPCDVGVKPGQVRRDVLAPLAALAASFTGRPEEDAGPATAMVTQEQFLVWADAVRLLEALDCLFGGVLRPGLDGQKEQ